MGTSSNYRLPPWPKQWPSLSAMQLPSPQYYSFILLPPNNTSRQSICPHWSTKNTSPQSICPQSTKAYLQRSSRVRDTSKTEKSSHHDLYWVRSWQQGKCWPELTIGKMFTRVDRIMYNISWQQKHNIQKLMPIKNKAKISLNILKYPWCNYIDFFAW